MRMLPLCCLLLTSSAFAADTNTAPDLQRALLHLSISNTLMTEDAIDWAVGDSASYNLTMRYGKGTMVQSVTKDEGKSLWLRQILTLNGKKQVLDVLLSKADGSIQRMLENGEEAEIPADEGLEILSADERRITVPAGTFNCLHIVAKMSDGYRLESWVDPEDTVMDGTIKQIVGSDMGNIVLELASFKRGRRA